MPPHSDAPHGLEVVQAAPKTQEPAVVELDRAVVQRWLIGDF